MAIFGKLYKSLEAENLWQDISIKRNAFISFCGKIDSNLYFVEEGSIRIFIESNGEEHTIRLGYQNSFVSALDSFITEKPSILYIQALKKCRLKVVAKAQYMKFIKQSPANLKMWTELLEQLVYQQFEREIDILITTPGERYERVLKRSPQLFQEIPHKYIASYLRMAPETLSRLKKS